MLTNQEMFNLAYIGVSKQGKPALNQTYNCRYRQVEDDGTVLKCALGFCISDAVYSKYGENYSGREYAFKLNEEGCNVSDELALQMQRAHDETGKRMYNEPALDFVGTFQKRMQSIALSFGLTFPVVE